MLRSIVVASLVLVGLLNCSEQNILAYQNKEKPDPPGVASKKILSKLLAAPKDKQHEFLLELRNGRGSPYTDTLVDAIEQLPGDESKEMARQTLVKRFERMKATVLAEYMQDNDRELRLAAVIAIRSKNDTTLAEHVIPLLADSDPQVAAAALETFKVLKK